MTSDAVIEVRGFAKHYGDIQAVNGVDFDVRSGEIFGFLGPNGAGKTTTINVLTGLARPDAGTIRVAGMDCAGYPKAAQHLIGVVPEESNLYPELTGLDNLCFSAALYGMRRAEREDRARELLATFGLADASTRKFQSYSKGMKRKLTMAAGIIHRPRILFLDEPTTGIDVASARQIRQLIADLRRDGTTIFLTTHYIEEAERLCDRIAFILAGRIVRTDTVANLIQPLKGRHEMTLTVSRSNSTLAEQMSSVFPQIRFYHISESQLRLESPEPILVGPLARYLEEQGVEVTEAHKVQPALEDVFVAVTGIEAAAMRKEREKPGGGA